MKTPSLAAFLLIFAGAALAAPPPAKPHFNAGNKHEIAPLSPPPTTRGVVSCTTQGDALGGLVITAEGNKIAMTEKGMDGMTKKYFADYSAQPAVPADLRGGRAATFYFRDFQKKSNDFGGAVSDAQLVALSAKAAAGQKRTGVLARSGNVYLLACEP